MCIGLLASLSLPIVTARVYPVNTRGLLAKITLVQGVDTRSNDSAPRHFVRCAGATQ